jgi:hypothetical protein
MMNREGTVAFSFENRVGRLIEVRLEGAMTDDDAQKFRTRMYLVLGNVSGRAVLLGDLQRCEMFTPEVGEKMLTMLKNDNPKVERTAFVLRGGALALQVERIVTEASLVAVRTGKVAPPRRTFRDKLMARDWLAEVLTPAERERLSIAIDAM